MENIKIIVIPSLLNVTKEKISFIVQKQFTFANNTIIHLHVLEAILYVAHLIVNMFFSWCIYFITVWKMVIMVIIKSIYMVYTILLLQALWNSGNRNWNHKGAVEMRLKILLREYIDILPSALAFAIIFRILSHFVSCDLYCESQMYYWMLCHKLLYRIFCDQGTASQIPLFKAWIIIIIIFFFLLFYIWLSILHHRI